MPTPRSSKPLLCAPTPEDLPLLGRMAYATGFFGQSAARYMPDRRLFALLWVWPYLHGAGGAGCLLARSEKGAPLGYILGAADPQAYASALARAVALGTLATLGGEVARPLQSWRYPLRTALYSGPHASTRLYPAHLHINLLPQARGLGLGSRLLAAHLQALSAAGVAGVQLSTTTENTAALGLYRKFGFEVLSEAESALWEPWLGRSTTHVVMGRRL